MDKEDKYSPLHFGDMSYKPDRVRVLPVVGVDGKPWKGEVKPKEFRHPFTEPISDE